jgi:hypothetical protein
MLAFEDLWWEYQRFLLGEAMGQQDRERIRFYVGVICGASQYQHDYRGGCRAVAHVVARRSASDQSCGASAGRGRDLESGRRRDPA